MREQIRTFILDNFLFSSDAALLDDNGSLLGEGILDSTGVLELVAFIEQEWPIHVENDEIVPAHLDSVAAIVAFIQRKLTAAALVGRPTT